MKIIAKQRYNTFLIEATDEEINRMAGKEVVQRDYQNQALPWAIGSEFNVIKAFDQIHRNNHRKKEIETVRKTLEGVLNSLDIIEPFIEEPPTESPKE